MTTFLLIASVAAPLVARAAQLQKVQLTEAQADEFGARCLDGSAYAFYVSHGTTVDEDAPRDWVFYLQAGGECDTAEDCSKRAKGDLGSSREYPATKDDTQVSDGITSSVAAENPHFASFGTIYMPYCSGDDWMGMQTVRCDPWNDKESCSKSRPSAPIPTPSQAAPVGSTLFFSGHNNIEAALNVSLYSRFKSSGGVRSVILSGGSAGGQGSFFHIDFLADKLLTLSPTTIFKSNPQVGTQAKPSR